MGKSKRKPFIKIESKNAKSIDAVSTDTTEPITLAEEGSNIYPQLLVDAETVHT